MKKMILRTSIILLIFQLMICMGNINIVSADMMENIEGDAQTFTQMGANKITILGISADKMSEPLVFILGIVQMAVIAFACIRLLLTALRILSKDTIDKAEAKKELSIDLIILFCGVAGPALAKEIILIFG